jgi:hypothetical protein
MNLPDFVKSLAFWKAATFLVAGVLALLAYFQVVPANWAIGSEVILAWVLALLQMFGINPELKAKALMKEVEALKARLR